MNKLNQYMPYKFWKDAYDEVSEYYFKGAEPYLEIKLSSVYVNAAIERIAKVLDPLAFIEYKDGDVFPRGCASYSLETMNNFQKARKQMVLKKAKKILIALSPHFKDIK